MLSSILVFFFLMDKMVWFVISFYVLRAHFLKTQIDVRNFFSIVNIYNCKYFKQESWSSRNPCLVSNFHVKCLSICSSYKLLMWFKSVWSTRRLSTWFDMVGLFMIYVTRLFLTNSFANYHIFLIFIFMVWLSRFLNIILD